MVLHGHARSVRRVAPARAFRRLAVEHPRSRSSLHAGVTAERRMAQQPAEFRTEEAQERVKGVDGYVATTRRARGHGGPRARGTRSRADARRRVGRPCRVERFSEGVGSGRAELIGLCLKGQLRGCV